MLNDLNKPVNVSEKYLYGINMRLEVLIEQMTSLLNYIAVKENVAVTNAVVEQEVVAVEVAPVETKRKRKVKE